MRVDTPFDAISPSYNMPVYTGTMSAGRAIKVYGKGIYALAKGEGDSATPTQDDDKYRTADFQVVRVDGDHFWFGPNANGAIPAGGDSGGPAFINAGGQTLPRRHQLALSYQRSPGQDQPQGRRLDVGRKDQ